MKIARSATMRYLMEQIQTDIRALDLDRLWRRRRGSVKSSE